MVLSSALDGGYAFITLVAVLTSVISAVYYLSVIKRIFFEKNEKFLNPVMDGLLIKGQVKYYNLMSFFYKDIETDISTVDDVVLSNYLTVSISSLTLLLLLFVFTPQETLSMANILALNLSNNFK